MPKKKIRDWSPEQRAAFETLDKTLLVAAAAGSGKTATLTERVLRMLTDPVNPCDITRMAIVTFTVAAADDLKNKLSETMIEKIRKNPSDPQLPEQLLLLPSADVGTIDSFCRRIASEFSDLTGIRPNCRVLGGSDEGPLRRAVLEALIDRLYDGREGSVASGDAFCEFASQVVESKHQKEIEDIFLKVSSEADNFPEGEKKLDDYVRMIEEACNQPPEKTEYGKALLARLAERCRDAIAPLETMRDELAGETDAVKEALEPAIDGALEKCRRFGSADPSVTYSEAREFVCTYCDDEKTPINIKLNKRPYNATSKEYRPLINAGFKRLYSDLGARFLPLFLPTEEDWKTEAATHLPLSELIAKAVRRFNELVRIEKQRINGASFADIERAALDLLIDPETGERTPAAEELASRYDAIFVDEYQDINPIQHAIFKAISRERNLFLVGDVKQSIYRFRRADPTIFISLKKAFPPLSRAGDGPEATVFLSNNYRCEEPIVDFVNGVFHPLFSAIGDSIGYTPEDDLSFAKVPEERLPEPVLPVVRLFRSPKNERGTAPEDPECAWVAEEIRRLIDTCTRPNPEWDEEKPDKHPRFIPIQPEDVVILLRKADPAPAFRASLEKRGVPASIEISGDLFDAPEIRLALCLLNTVDNPRRDIPLVGLLLSPLCEGFTPAILTEIKRASDVPGEPFYDSLVKYVKARRESEPFEAGERFLRQLESFRRAAEGMPVDRLILKLFTETGLLPIGGATNPAAGRENLLLFYQYARSFEATSFRGLYRFVSYMNDMAAIGKSPDLQPPATAGGVKIMTIHHSKGLERPVVFVSRVPTSTQTHGITTDRNVSFNARFGLTTKVRDEQTGLARIDTPFRRIAELDLTILDKEEEFRVFYVALTRARERLYVTASVQNNANIDNRREKYSDVSPITRTDAILGPGMFDLIVRAIGGEGSKLATVILPEDEPKQPAETDPALETSDVKTTGETPVSGEPEAAEAGAEADLSEPTAAGEKTAAPEPVPTIPSEDGTLLTEDEACKRLKERFDESYPDPWLGTVPGKLSVSVLSPSVLDGANEGTATLDDKKKQEKKTSAEGAASRRKGAGDPALRGTATHLFLQFCDLEQLRKNGAEVELERLCKGGFLTKETRDLVDLSELEMFRSSALLDEMLSRTWMQRELRFNMMMPASNFTKDPDQQEKLKDQTVLVQGVMDCAFTTADGELVLLDYKTDRLKGGVRASDDEINAFALRHREQLRYYAIAVEKMLGRKPDRILLYPLCLGRAVEVSL